MGKIKGVTLCIEDKRACVAICLFLCILTQFDFHPSSKQFFSNDRNLFERLPLCVFSLEFEFL